MEKEWKYYKKIIIVIHTPSYIVFNFFMKEWMKILVE